MTACCDRFAWELVCALPHAEGCDFDLGRCRNCHQDLIAVYNDYSPKADRCQYVPITTQIVQELLNLPEGPERKKYLKEWINNTT